MFTIKQLYTRNRSEDCIGVKATGIKPHTHYAYPIPPLSTEYLIYRIIYQRSKKISLYLLNNRN